MKEESKHFRLDEQGVLWFKDRLVVPKDRELRNQILEEAHSSKLSIHPGSSKMYQDLKTRFWWTKMKKEIAAYVFTPKFREKNVGTRSFQNCVDQGIDCMRIDIS